MTYEDLKKQLSSGTTGFDFMENVDFSKLPPEEQSLFNAMLIEKELRKWVREKSPGYYVDDSRLPGTIYTTTLKHSKDSIGSTSVRLNDLQPGESKVIITIWENGRLVSEYPVNVGSGEKISKATLQSILISLVLPK